MTTRRWLLVAAVLVALPLTTGAGCIVGIGQSSDDAADKPVIEQTPNICLTLTKDAKSQAVVGKTVPYNAITDNPTGSHSCVWPASVTPIGAEVSVEITVNTDGAESSARQQLTNFVESNTCVAGSSYSKRTCGTRDVESTRVLGRIPYGDKACVGAYNHKDLGYVAIMKEGNVITTVSIQTRRAVSTSQLRALAGDVRGPLRTVLRAADAAIKRPPNVFRDPSGDLPKPLTQAQREIAPDWNARDCKEKQAPPVFNL